MVTEGLKRCVVRVEVLKCKFKDAWASKHVR